MFDFENVDLESEKTWDLISSGNTKGCFQLESRLGRSLAKKLKPSNIEELSALISIMRPGCLEAVRDGKSVTNHYIDKKNKLEDVDFFHDSLKTILGNTYGEMVYQEQAMQIAKEIAGFDLQEADLLRKAIGKKKPEEMAKLKQKFIEGAGKLNIVNKEQAEEIFNWIEKSQRYSFNKSHAVSYAMNCYLSAYMKAHYPVYFFTAYLRFAKDKIDPQQEIKELVQNANEMNIDVCNPDIRLKNELIQLGENNCIYFGLTDIKGFGLSAYQKLIKLVDDQNLNLETMTWTEVLFKVLLNINSTSAKSLICSGAIDYTGNTRNKMLFEFNLASQLTKKEADLALQNLTLDKSISKTLSNIIGLVKLSKRKEVILNMLHSIAHPPYSLEDSIEWLVDNENSLLGYSISCSKIDMYDIQNVNYTCRDVKNLKTPNQNILIAGEIESINITKTKKGKSAGAKMAFVTLNDGTASLDSVIYFPEQYSLYSNQLFESNVVIIKGNLSKDKTAFVAEKTYVART